MTVVAVLGGGAGGAAAAADLTTRGHRVRLWNRREETIAGFRRAGIVYRGVLGDDRAEPETITTDLRQALDGAAVAIVCLPAITHRQLADDLAGIGVELPIVLNPGHTGGALHFVHRFRSAGRQPPPIAELSTLTYVARRDGDRVSISGRAGRVHAACLPGGASALEHALELFPACQPVADVLATSLANVNLVLHPPGALLGAAWVEATGGDFTFYVEGMTSGVARVLARLDVERRTVASAYGHGLPDILQEMTAIGTVDPEVARTGDVAAAIRSGGANATIRAPDSLDHRYYTEDLGYGLLPFTVLADVAGVDVPLARALLEVGATLVGEHVRTSGLGAEQLGIAGDDRAMLLARVRSGHVVDAGR
jgi:opine dehydrogenase